MALRRGCFQAEQRREGLGRGVRLEAGPSHRFSEPQEALGPGNGEGRAELYQGPLCAQVGQGAEGAGGPSLRKDSATRGSLEARLSAQRLRCNSSSPARTRLCPAQCARLRRVSLSPAPQGAPLPNGKPSWSSRLSRHQD